MLPGFARTQNNVGYTFHDRKEEMGLSSVRHKYIPVSFLRFSTKIQRFILSIALSMDNIAFAA